MDLHSADDEIASEDLFDLDTLNGVNCLAVLGEEVCRLRQGLHIHRFVKLLESADSYRSPAGRAFAEVLEALLIVVDLVVAHLHDEGHIVFHDHLKEVAHGGLGWSTGCDHVSFSEGCIDVAGIYVVPEIIVLLVFARERIATILLYHIAVVYHREAHAHGAPERKRRLFGFRLLLWMQVLERK